MSTNTGKAIAQAFDDYHHENPSTFDGSTIGLSKDNEFLNNRLYRAFMAGADAGQRIERENALAQFKRLLEGGL